MKTNGIVCALSTVFMTLFGMPAAAQFYHWEPVIEAVVNGDSLCTAFTGGLALPFVGSPAFFDLDHDGDVEFFFAGNSSTVVYYENTSNSSTNANPCWNLTPTPLDGVVTPMGFFGSLGSIAPYFADIDGDGEIDLISGGGLGGGEGGTIYYFRDLVPGDSVHFVLQDTLLAGVDAYDFGNPCAADVDSDGDNDIVIGGGLGDVFFCRNNGNGTWATPVMIYSQSGSGDDKASPALADLDGDSLPELLIGEAYGSLRYFKITSVTTDTVIWTMLEADYLGLSSFPYITFTKPILVKYSTDSLFDLFVAYQSDHKLLYYKNTGTRDSAIWGSPEVFQFTIDVSNTQLSRPVLDFADVNGDGIKDIILSMLVANTNLDLGNLLVYENHGEDTAPQWELATTHLLGNQLDNYTYITGMSFYDVVGDSLPDLFIGVDSLDHQKILLYQNNSSSGSYEFDRVSDASLEAIDSTISLEIGEINLNGKPDLLVTIYGTTGNIQWYELSDGIWQLVTQDLLTVSKDNYAEIVDFNFDSIPDIVATDNLDNFSFYQNMGMNQGIPIFERQTPVLNYFSGITVSERKPIFGNVDGMCGLDLLQGGTNGGIYLWGFRGITPTIDAPPMLVYNLCDSTPITLHATPSGGTWNNWVNSSGTFIPSEFPKTDIYPLIYTYSDPSGCYVKSDTVFITVDDCTSVHDISRPSVFSVSPNPVHNELWIRFLGQFEEIRELTLINTLGQSQQMKIDSPSAQDQILYWKRPYGIPPGVYFITLSTNRTRFTRRIMLD